MALLDEMRDSMIAQADAAAANADDATLFEMLAYCNRYSRQRPLDYTGPKMKDGNRVPQAFFVEIEVYVRALRGKADQAPAPLVRW